METALYLLPVTLGETPTGRVLPPFNQTIIRELRHFIVEEVRSARRFLKQVDKDIDINRLTFSPMGKHADEALFHTCLAPLRSGESIGLLSEAGCPAIADPGSLLVELAQREGLRVVPLVGPSSLLLALMASGFNGQSFAFNGYLPIDEAERRAHLHRLETQIYAQRQTQLFIETPFRNERLLQTLLATLRPQTKLCIAAGLTTDDEYVQTKSIAEWKKHAPRSLHKIPTVFLLYQ